MGNVLTRISSPKSSGSHKGAWDDGQSWDDGHDFAPSEEIVEATEKGLISGPYLFSPSQDTRPDSSDSTSASVPSLSASAPSFSSSARSMPTEDLNWPLVDDHMEERRVKSEGNITEETKLLQDGRRCSRMLEKGGSEAWDGLDAAGCRHVRWKGLHA